MQQKTYLCHSPLGFHHVAYTEWGEVTAKPPVLCVHGLTRNGRDFDHLALSLQMERKVFCPDIVGRGKSDWLSDPSLYGYPQYMADLTALIARMGAGSIDWVGTSLGGILGMLMAAQPNTPIRRLVVNDVGPFISMEALKRIGSYVSVIPEFAGLDQAERYMRQIYAPFGITKDEDWKNMAVHGVRKLPDGKLALGYDPAIGKSFLTIDKDVDFWDAYDRIRCPMLLLHGMKSDVLTDATAQEMTQRGPKPKLVQFPDIGHAPALMDAEQTGIIGAFLA